MKLTTLALGAAVLLAGCGQNSPDTSKPTATAPAAAPDAAAPDTTAAAAAAVPPAETASAAVAPNAETLKLSFAFKPTPNAADAAHPRTSAHLLLKGAKPMDVDLGKFAARPDLVDAEKGREANFPSGMLMGFRSYQASSGVSEDLAVLKIDARHLRIVQRRVEETATAPVKFETSREISIPANTTVSVEPPPPPAPKAAKK